jgi:hypothetical protein
MAKTQRIGIVRMAIIVSAITTGLAFPGPAWSGALSGCFPHDFEDITTVCIEYNDGDCDTLTSSFHYGRLHFSSASGEGGFYGRAPAGDIEINYVDDNGLPGPDEQSVLISDIDGYDFRLLSIHVKNDGGDPLYIEGLAGSSWVLLATAQPSSGALDYDFPEAPFVSQIRLRSEGFSIYNTYFDDITIIHTTGTPTNPELTDLAETTPAGNALFFPYEFGEPPIRLDTGPPAQLLADSASGWSGGAIEVSASAPGFGTGSPTIGIATEGGLTLSDGMNPGSQVNLDTRHIGTLSPDTTADSMTVELEAAATTTDVESVIRLLTFADDDPTATDYITTVTTSVTNGCRLSSDPDSPEVRVRIDARSSVDQPARISGLSPATFTEDWAAAPRVLDTSVDVTGIRSYSLDGSVLSVTGVLPEDRLSVRVRTPASIGSIRRVGSTVESYLEGADFSASWVPIGTMSLAPGETGAGEDLVIRFNAAATRDAIDNVIESLTYQNGSDAPTPKRSLFVSFREAAWPTWSSPQGAKDPFAHLAAPSGWAHPAIGDLDDDGDLDLVLGNIHGFFRYYRNDGDADEPVFVLQSAGENPLDGIDVGGFPSGTLVDLDGDGDLDLVAGDQNGSRLVFVRNDGTPQTPSFVVISGPEDPFDGLDIETGPSPAFGDLDGDGDLDCAVGHFSSVLNRLLIAYLRNDGTPQNPQFTVVASASGPFEGLPAIGNYVSPRIVDLDGDGLLDIVAGSNRQTISLIRNTGTSTEPVFDIVTGPADPFADVTTATVPHIEVVDIDGSGGLDVIVGASAGHVSGLFGGPSFGTIMTTVTPVNDAPTLDGAQSPVFPTIGEDEGSSASTVESLVDSAWIDDVDEGDELGFAVTGIDTTNGRWQYVIVTGWQDIAAPTGGWIDISANALLFGPLPPSRGGIGGLRFVPNPDFFGTATMELRAWDGTVGSSGGFADATTTGGSSAFSRTTLIATVTVTPVNDPPTVQAPPSVIVTSGEPFTFGSDPSAAVQVGDIDAGNADVQVSLTSQGGLLSVGQGTGATVAGNGTSQVTLTGTLVDLNSALDALTFDSSATFEADSVLISIDDQGATGDGGALSASATIEISVDDGAPPQVVSVRDGNGFDLPVCDGLSTAPTSLAPEFSEPMGPSGVTGDPNSYLVVAAGPDGRVDTQACGVLQGDDVPWPIDATSHADPSNTTTLTLADPLPSGMIRILACTVLEDLAGNALDGDGDGVPGDPFIQPFRVDVGNRFANGHFDCDAFGWTVDEDTAGSVNWDGLTDADDSPDSGAVEFRQLGSDTQYRIGQCVEALNPRSIELSARALAPTGADMAVSCDVYSSASCSGAPSTRVIDTDVVASANDWQPVHLTTSYEGDAASLRCWVRVTPSADPSFIAHLDQIHLTVEGALFADGFESGTTDAWSAP